MLTMPKPATTSPGAPELPAAVSVGDVSYRYGERQALQNVSLEIARGEFFAVLGPNGGGKSTLFRLLSTLIGLQQGSAAILGRDLVRQQAAVRQSIGVVFQSPSLDRKLTVAENIRLMGRLYGLSGQELDRRLAEQLDAFALGDRAQELVEKLSGGLKRRVELAKGMIHQPPLLLLDEPTTGLDPAARSDLWQRLRALRDEQGTTIVFTTHYLEEADAADRLAILDEGRVVAMGSADALRGELGGDSLTLETDRPEPLAAAVSSRLGWEARVVDGSVRLENPQAHRRIAELVEAFPQEIRAVRLGKPSLEDVFIARTGRRFWSDRLEEGRR